MFRFKRFLRGSKGANAVEFALIAPVFLLLVFGMIDFGLVFRDWLILTNGVREGARAGVVTYCEPGEPCDDDIIKGLKEDAATNAVTNYVSSTLGTLDSLTVTCTPDPDGYCRSGDALTVEACHVTPLVTPLGNFMAWFGGGIAGEFRLCATSEMRNE